MVAFHFWPLSEPVKAWLTCALVFGLGSKETGRVCRNLSLVTLQYGSYRIGSMMLRFKVQGLNSGPGFGLVLPICMTFL